MIRSGRDKVETPEQVNSTAPEKFLIFSFNLMVS